MLGWTSSWHLNGTHFDPELIGGLGVSSVILGGKSELQLPTCKAGHLASFSFWIISAGGKKTASLANFVSRLPKHILMKSTKVLLLGWTMGTKDVPWRRQWLLSDQWPLSHDTEDVFTLIQSVRGVNTGFFLLHGSKWIGPTLKITLTERRDALWVHVLACLDIYRVYLLIILFRIYLIYWNIWGC